MPEEKKPKCPECETELVLIDGKLPKKCAKCGFQIAAGKQFDRLMDAYFKNKKKQKPETEEDDDDSFFGALLNE